eukprot:284159_1
MNAAQILIGVQFSIFSVLLLSIDTYQRIKQEKTRKHWQLSKFFPSWSHVRFSTVYTTTNILIWSILHIYSNDNYQTNLSIIIISTLFLPILIIDLLMTVCAAARFLMMKYGIKRNPFGYTIFSIGSLALIINWILLLISLYNNDLLSFNWSDLYLLIMFAIYLIFSIMVEYIYFSAGHVFVFENNSCIVSGIYGFLGAFVRTFFHGLYVIVKYIVIILIIVIVAVSDTKIFYLYIFPFVMELLLFFLFFSRKKNRPEPCICFELKIWRPFVEYWWYVAIKTYKQRNPDEPVNKIRWKDITQPKESDESSSDKKQHENINKKTEITQRQRRLLRTISQHADI